MNKEEKEEQDRREAQFPKMIASVEDVDPAELEHGQTVGQLTEKGIERFEYCNAAREESQRQIDRLRDMLIRVNMYGRDLWDKILSESEMLWEIHDCHVQALSIDMNTGEIRVKFEEEDRDEAEQKPSFRTCPECGHQSRIAARFCSMCGTKLTEREAEKKSRENE